MRRVDVRVALAVLWLTSVGCSAEKSAPSDLGSGAHDAATQPPPPDLFGADLFGVVFDLTTQPDLAVDDPADMTANDPPDLSHADLKPPPDLTPKPDLIGADLAPPPVATIAGCQILPSNHIFNTPINGLPPHGSSTAFMATIEDRPIHLDLGRETNTQDDEYYGIPYNVIHASQLTWPRVAYQTAAGGFTWDPKSESDCASGTAHTFVSPCTTANASMPLLPIPGSPLVEGGLWPDNGGHGGDHHILLLDADSCQLWEVYHAFTGTGANAVPYHIFGSARFDLASNNLRPKGWTSADAAGFPILPLLLRADEAESGVIRHALRFTIASASIRNSFVWPARHLTDNGGSSSSKPQMGQLFRIKSSYTIPPGYSKQSKAILQALKTYGMYLADGGTDLYIQGEPSAAWDDSIFDEVQSVGRSQFEAVDITAITSRAGWSENSGAVPPAQ